MPDILYDGTKLHWYGFGVYKATSGFADNKLQVNYQTSSQQSVPNLGPIPAGLYSFPTTIANDATVDGYDSGGRPQLDTRDGIERVPNPIAQGTRQFTTSGWGPDRVRLTVEYMDDPQNRGRDGFYLHDSTKGHSIGCIEVDGLFFRRLRKHITQKSKGTRLYLRVKYGSPDASTYGRTDFPNEDPHGTPRTPTRS